MLPFDFYLQYQSFIKPDYYNLYVVNDNIIYLILTNSKIETKRYEFNTVIILLNSLLYRECFVEFAMHTTRGFVYSEGNYIKER